VGIPYCGESGVGWVLFGGVWADLGEENFVFDAVVGAMRMKLVV
jgi:hypothetical protein